MRRRSKARAKTVTLRNFSGKIRRNPNGSVEIVGVGKKTKSRRRNVAAGYVDGAGRFHPLRASYDYSPKRAGEKSPWVRGRAAPKRKARRKK